LFGLIVAFGGVFANITGGTLSDYFSQKDAGAYAKICKIGTIIAWPAFTIAMLANNNFWLAMMGMAGKYIFGENFWSPNVTMIQ